MGSDEAAVAILTPLSLAEARAMGHLYGLDVEAVRGIPAGSVNSNFELTLRPAGPAEPPGRVFCRVYEEQTSHTASREALLLSHLAGLGIPTPEPLRRTLGEGFIAEVAGKPAALFPWRAGQIRCQSLVTPADTEAVGATLAAIHEAGATFTERARREGAAPLGESRFDRAALLARLGGLPRDAGPEIEAAAGRARAFLETFDPGRAAGPLGLIHGDLFRDNVLWLGAELCAVLDFESASLGDQAFDLMVVVLAWCFGDQLDEPLARGALAGYRRVRGPVMSPEALYEQGRFAAVRFAVTRITDFELRRRDAGPGVGVYKDFRRFLARWDALEALGAVGLERLSAPIA